MPGIDRFRLIVFSDFQGFSTKKSGISMEMGGVLIGGGGGGDILDPLIICM